MCRLSLCMSVVFPLPAMPTTSTTVGDVRVAAGKASCATSFTSCCGVNEAEGVVSVLSCIFQTLCFAAAACLTALPSSAPDQGYRSRHVPRTRRIFCLEAENRHNGELLGQFHGHGLAKVMKT